MSRAIQLKLISILCICPTLMEYQENQMKVDR